MEKSKVKDLVADKCNKWTVHKKVGGAQCSALKMH